MNAILFDRNIHDILLGVASNVLTALIAVSARVTRRSLSVPTETDFKPDRLLRSSIQRTSDSFVWKGPGKLEEVCLFLSLPETENIIRQLFSSKLIDREQDALEDIQAEFIRCLALFLEVPSEDILAPHARALFLELTAACEATLDAALNRGEVGAHEIKSTLRHNVLLDELEAINKNLAFLSRQPVRPKAVLSFKERYRSQVRDRHSEIVPPNFDGVRRIPMDELYVPPTLTRLRSDDGREDVFITVRRLQETLKRAVLLGNPGGGKSTLAQKFIHDMTTPRDRPGPTPILVILREYGALKQQRSYSLLQFIELSANATYQVAPPPGAFEYMLLNAHSVVIFDGLDELLDTSHRREIARDIESFCSLFPSLPVLVTSRQVGYEQAPLDRKRFDTFILDSFTDQQVRDYVSKWFRAGRDLTLEQRTAMEAAFFSESRIVAELCTNPLMLALMCNIYRGENYIPANRPDVYEKCALMLFDRWDKGRGIRVALPIDAHVRPAMMHLAYWIYADNALQSGVTERKLVEKTVDYLCPHRFEDRDEALSAAQQFIEFCAGRAWVFTDTGTTREGERLYQFTHRTFLEYFTAAQLVRTHPTPETLLPVLLTKIAKREWDVVAQLAFQIQNKNVEGAGDALLLQLIDASSSAEHDAWTYLSFATRCLEFIVPSPKVCRTLALRCVEQFLNTDLYPHDMQARINEPREAMGGLLCAASENQNVIVDALESDLVRRIDDADNTKALRAAELALHIDACLDSRSRAASRPNSEPWRNFSNRIAQVTAPRLSDLAKFDLRLARDMFVRGRGTITTLLERFGAEALFKSRSYELFPDIPFNTLGEVIAHSVINPTLVEQCWNRRSTLQEVGAWILTTPKPLTELRSFSLQLTHSDLWHDAAPAPIPPLEADEIFAAFALLAVFVEAHSSDWAKDFEDAFSRGRNLLDLFGPVFALRDRDASPERIAEELLSFPINDQQKKFVIDWVTGRFDLLAPDPWA